MSWTLNKTEQRIIDTFVKSEDFQPTNDRERKAARKIRDAFNATGLVGGIAGIVIARDWHTLNPSYRFITLNNAVNVFQEHFDMREIPGTRKISIRT